MKKILAILLLMVLLTSCKGKTNNYKVERDKNGVLTASTELFAMDTYMTLTCCGERCEEALEASVEEIRRLDGLLSVGNADSEVARLNKAGKATLSDDTAKILSESLWIHEVTDGAFDCTVYPLMKLWGFTTSQFAVPQEKTLAQTLKTVGSDKLSYDAKTKTLTLGKAGGVDFGGIAKGYTSDRLMAIFKEYDLKSGCVSLGGNVQFYGTKTDGSLWRCGVKNPDDPDSDAYLGVLEGKDTAVITSGGYERNFTDEKTGKTYHHILDPKTGYPAESGLRSVTIVCDSGVTADALSTAVYIMGFEKAKAFWRSHSGEFDMILQTDDKTVYVTKPLADRFTSDLTVEILSQK